MGSCIRCVCVCVCELIVNEKPLFPLNSCPLESPYGGIIPRVPLFTDVCGLAQTLPDLP